MVSNFRPMKGGIKILINNISKTILAIVITAILMITVVIPTLHHMLSKTMENMRNFEIITTYN